MEQQEKTVAIKWHPGFYSGLELELRDYRDVLNFKPEHSLSKEPLRIDMLVIKKKPNVKIDNPIAEIFREHNIVEYKSPHDSLSIDSLYKTIGYACLYKGLGRTIGEIRESNLTVSVFRHNYPRELFKSLDQTNINVESPYSGIYRITGIINFPVQIVITKELTKGKHTALKILTNNADESDVKKFILEAEKYSIPVDKQNADAVLQVSVSSNMDLYEQIRKEHNMCDALNNLMKDELDAREKQGEARGQTQGINKLKEATIAIKNGVSISEIKEQYGEEIFSTAESLIKSLV